MSYTYETNDDPKMLRETLCVAQNKILNSPYDKARNMEYAKALQRLINECDRKRPIGFDGKHGDRHTATCGCDIPRTLGEHIASDIIIEIMSLFINGEPQVGTRRILESMKDEDFGTVFMMIKILCEALTNFWSSEEWSQNMLEVAMKKLEGLGGD
jgi:hypothetical protein